MVVDEDLSMQQVVGNILNSPPKNHVYRRKLHRWIYRPPHHLRTRKQHLLSWFCSELCQRTEAGYTRCRPAGHGAIWSRSKETASQMVKGALRVLKTDYATGHYRHHGARWRYGRKASRYGMDWCGQCHENRNASFPVPVRQAAEYGTCSHICIEYSPEIHTAMTS